MKKDNEKTLEDLMEVAVSIVKRAADIALNPPYELEIQTKSNPNDLVTIMDRKIEDYIAAELGTLCDYPMLGEEAHTVNSYQGRVWVLDPIDGTMNYVATKRDWAISLALCEDGVPIMGILADPVRGKYYTALAGRGAFCNGKLIEKVNSITDYTKSIIITDLKEMIALPRLLRVLEESRGHRRYGSAALELVEVAIGQAGAFVHMWVSPWDIAAASLICKESGVKVTRLDGTRLDIREKGSILAAIPQVHTDLLDRLFTRSRY